MRVAHVRQSTGGLPGRGSGEVPTVDHDLSALIGNDGRDGGQLVEGQTSGAGKVVFSPVHAQQHLEEMKCIAALNLRVKLLPRDGCRHWTLGSLTGTGCRAAAEKEPTPELASSADRH